MKRLIKSIPFFVVVLILSSALNAQTKTEHSDLEVNIHPLNDSGKLRVIFINPNVSKVNVILKNNKGDIVFNETTKEFNYKRDFDFSKLESGLYTIQVRNNEVAFDREFLVKDRIAQKTVSLMADDVAHSKRK